MDKRTALYRHYGAKGSLLYVGVSLSPVERLSQHNKDSCWSKEIVRVECEWFESTDEARIAERKAIIKDKPMHNKQCAKSTKMGDEALFSKDGIDSILHLMRLNQTSAYVFMFMVRNMKPDNSLIVSQSSIAEILGYSLRSISRATTYLKENKYLQVAKTGTSSIYHINAHIVNVDHGVKGRAGRFSAAVILGESEMKLSGFYDFK